jgi:type III secretory pathway component EscT
MAGLVVMLAPVLAASLLDRVPGIAFGLPLLIAASAVFAATHHEQPDAIRTAMLQWLVWLGVILGVVLGIVLVIGIWV